MRKFVAIVTEVLHIPCALCVMALLWRSEKLRMGRNGCVMSEFAHCTNNLLTFTQCIVVHLHILRVQLVSLHSSRVRPSAIVK